MDTPVYVLTVHGLQNVTQEVVKLLQYCKILVEKNSVWSVCFGKTSADDSVLCKKKKTL